MCALSFHTILRHGAFHSYAQLAKRDSEAPGGSIQADCLLGRCVILQRGVALVFLDPGFLDCADS